MEIKERILAILLALSFLAQANHIIIYLSTGNVAAELSFILPDHKVSVFPEMLKKFENSRSELGILGFGFSVTTLEEVFMK